MFIVANFIDSIARLVDIILFSMFWIILIRALISWVNPDPFNPIVQFLQRVTDPILLPIRRALRMQFWAIDISPFIAILVIFTLQTFLVQTLRDIAMRLR